MTQEINFQKGFHDVVEGVSAIGVSMIHFAQKLDGMNKEDMSEFDKGRVAGAEMVTEMVRDSVLMVLKSVETILMAVLPEEDREEAVRAFNCMSGTNETVQ